MIKVLVTVEKEDRGKDKSIFHTGWCLLGEHKRDKNKRLIYRQIIQLKGTKSLLFMVNHKT